MLLNHIVLKDLSDEMGTSAWELFPRSHSYRVPSDASLHSISLPVLANVKVSSSEGKSDLQSMYDTSSSLNDIDQELKGNYVVGSLLPDDEDELLAGIMDDFEAKWLPNIVDDSEEYDLFGGGGLELESDPQENSRIGSFTLSLSNDGIGNTVAHSNQTNGVGTVAGEHPLGEHPSRTLFVRNINSNIEDAELRTLFELYGDIRTLYTASKHRGFVMVSYYDIRAARTAMRALQNKPLRRRKLDIHFSIPKENPSDKEINQGTLVVFNLDPSVTNDNLQQIFGDYGEVKEIRETPHKKHHKFIEFYDVRAAEAALKSLNRSDLAGKRIKVEPSRPGGARRSLLLHMNHEVEKDERTLHKVGLPLGNSPPATWPHLSSPNVGSPLLNFSKSSGFSSAGSSWGRQDIFELSHSLPEQKSSQFVGSDSFFGSSTFNGSTSIPFSGPKLYWGSSSEQTNSTPITQAVRNPFISGGNHGSLYNWSQIQQQHHRYHAGSAPSAAPLQQKFGYFHESPRSSFARPGCASAAYLGDLNDFGYRDVTNSTVSLMKSVSVGEGSPVSSMISSARPSHVFHGIARFPGHAASNWEALAERGRSRLIDSNGIQIDNKNQFQLDIDKIRTGEDTRTTLMIKNIPNKYTSKMLLATIDEHCKGTYDFLYLPIDFQNKCNIGYAFINLLSPLNIIPFYEAFNGKRWEKFNSEKVAYLAYARIQGKAALVAHFKHTTLMNEDKHCRPILFDSEFLESNNRVLQKNVPVNVSTGVQQSNEGETGNLTGSDQDEREQ
ncbi:protein MEI2-like 5 isoform X2 [Salvia splendens]|uniref:protein MEI2-like 5 isoform X2 n=1 Tax=Salvia splendens TaxID=180675 RepID=UPI001C26BEC4|nr:protein MEI2-like 5 isoform X2 [Salvia splendens]